MNLLENYLELGTRFWVCNDERFARFFDRLVPVDHRKIETKRAIWIGRNALSSWNANTY